MPTFFDGRGGVAGVQLTAEQRRAVTREALRRGMTDEQARELAYGNADPEAGGQADMRPMGVGEERVLARAPLYREVAPQEKVTAGRGATDREPAPMKGPEAEPGERKTEAQKGDERPEGQQKITDHLDEIMPDPLEEALGGLLPFRLWMAQICEPGAEPSWTVEHDIDQGTVTVTAESQMTDRSKVTAEVVVPVAAGGGAESDATPVVTVTVTDPRTDEVLVVSSPQVAEGPHDVTRVAIGEVVEAVLDANGAGHVGDVDGLIVEGAEESPHGGLPSVDAQEPA
ncbi:hypothetical protein [Streptomyces sp. DT117]|uniref:hypothetical protein n=1 Tax=Streptomyces sp. DT117 TaxID=3393422 RepID=UPI003CF84C5C